MRPATPQKKTNTQELRQKDWADEVVYYAIGCSKCSDGRAKSKIKLYTCVYIYIVASVPGLKLQNHSS